MECFKSFYTVKYIQNFVAFQLRRTRSNKRGIRRPFPIAEVVHKSVFLRIVVDVENQGHEIRIVCYRDATKPFLEQTTCPSISFVDGFGVGVEQVGKVLGRVIFLLRDLSRVFTGFQNP
jgi:hypothetical protein